MESELLQSLEDVGYPGPLLDGKRFNYALQEGPKSPDFTSLVSWLTNQIGSFGSTDESVHPTSSPDDANSFLAELSTFLKAIGCVNKKLISGNVNQRLANVQERCVLIEYLIAELMASKIIESKRPEDKAVEITISESITAKCMREMLLALRFQKPPDNISPALLFQKLQAKVSEVLKQVPKELVGKPLFFGELNGAQWDKLDTLHGELNEEYTIRREMMLKRLDVTVNSFAWSDRIRPKEGELNKCYHVKRDAMARDPDVTLAHLLSARDDLAIIEKTSNASVRKNTRSSINSVIIGAVPDRGGRSWEQEPPPPEMPPWIKDKVPTPQNASSQSSGYSGNSSYSSQGSTYSNQSSGYGGQGSNYGNQGSGYSNQGSGYSNQGSGYGNQGYERRSGGDYNKSGGQGQNRGGRVQGNWNQGGDSQYNRNQGQGGGRRY
ncbi:hypothetical protein QAD02_017565 [Eretmocerus hayati]|uniref:Uncharacterized protein n=1 Tax=Eretmocerus hayati TaxID=131215 RepID=A0ACC2PE86_9HYME|nr:hypothetical protein QAD02_017565 [Eretmocerus hayati]